jgi:hypothetical protein
MKVDSQKYVEKLDSLVKQHRVIEESVTDLKSRSMRDNLIFAGIPEYRDENCERVLQDFLYNKLNIEEKIPFERVHRIGRYDEFRTRPRDIVAKFSFFKDREFIRKRAPRKLRGSHIWINEQFPPEIEERRKKLYPVMRQARKEQKRVRLVKDILYINGEKYVAPENVQADAGLHSVPHPVNPPTNQRLSRTSDSDPDTRSPNHKRFRHHGPRR